MGKNPTIFASQNTKCTNVIFLGLFQQLDIVYLKVTIILPPPPPLKKTKNLRD